MKGKLYILFLFLLVAVSGKAQDFNPGPEARNLIEGKNVTVDYATGIFHYTVPLYSLKSGDYELPISLDYIGKGVKVSDPIGLVGYNWALNTGGIVTRTMRGGFADEEPSQGYIWQEKAVIPLEQDARTVGLRKRDGESDIFTAVFNGKKVDFIIRMDENWHIYALPLEQTDVRIECEGSASYIRGWTITDNNGDRYIYRQKEMCTVNYVDVSTSNSISDYSYTSAWHLTCILPYNGAPIEFHYNGDVTLAADNLPAGIINKIEIFDPCQMTYEYGMPMKEQPFDFTKYRSLFDSEIESAKNYLKMSSLVFRWENTDSKIRNFLNYGQINVQPLLNVYIKTNDRIAGILSNLSQMASASEQLEQNLKGLAATCHNMGYYADMAGSCLESAASCVHACLSEVKYVKTKEIWGGSNYKILSPSLNMIIFPDRVVKFTHNSSSSYLRAISLHNRNMERISSVSFGGMILSNLVFLDKDGKETSNMKFNYYDKSDFPFCKKEGKDIWGYPYAKNENEEDCEYECTECGAYTALYSLKSIILSDGGKIGIEYEGNRTRRARVGGIRLKSLAFSNKLGEQSDTISYDYPGEGISVFRRFSNIVAIIYPVLTDLISYSQVQQEGHPMINTGNNGFYYPFVRETVFGKGTTTYRYKVVAPEPMPVSDYPYWLNGLLTEKSLYDTKGKLLKKIQYTYEIYANSEDKLPQMQPSNFYLDEKALEFFYRQQGTPYLTGEEFYQYNIKPRLSPTNTDKFYNLQYEWKNALKEEIEYRNDEDIPYLKTKYHYDNPESMYPTRIIRIGSDNIERTEVLKRVIDMTSSTDSVFIKMKESNLLSSVVKSLSLINGELVSETVNRYQFSEGMKIGSIALTGKFTYIPDTIEVYVPTAVDTLLFNYGESNYITEASYQYASQMTSRVLVEANERTDRKSYVYDNYGKLLLECDVTGIAVCDKYKGTIKTIVKTDLDKALRYLRKFRFFLTEEWVDFVNNIDDKQFVNFLNSENHLFVISLAKGMLNNEVGFDQTKYYFEKTVCYDKKAFNQFKLEYERIIELYPNYDALKLLVEAIEILVQFDEVAFLDYLYSRFDIQEKPSYGFDHLLNLSSKPDTHNLRLYILDGAKTASGSITHSGGKTRFTIENASSTKLKVYDIDLTKYTDISSITIDTQGSYMALIPEGANFKATSYNADGTVYARFDQTENVEYYTYDAAGRVIQINDQYGNIIKTYEYNRLINQ